MATMKILFSLVFLLICWKLVSSQESQDVNDMSDNSEKDNFHDDRLAQSIPDIRVVLKNLLRYENSMKHPSEADSILTLSSRSSKNTLPKAGDTIDPIALLAAGFQGSRGKRLTFERIPLLAKGFQAHRGRK